MAFSTDSGLQTLTFRAAQHDDNARIAHFIVSASPHLLKQIFRLGDDEAVRFVQHCLKQNVGFYAQRFQHIVSVDGQAMGVISMFAGRFYPFLLLQVMMAFVAMFGWRRAVQSAPSCWRARFAYRKPARKGLYIAYLGLHRAIQRRGLMREAVASYVVTYAKKSASARVECDLGTQHPLAVSLPQQFDCHVRPACNRFALSKMLFGASGLLRVSVAIPAMVSEEPA